MASHQSITDFNAMLFFLLSHPTLGRFLFLTVFSMLLSLLENSKYMLFKQIVYILAQA
jgi:hypothetical protein